MYGHLRGVKMENEVKKQPIKLTPIICDPTHTMPYPIHHKPKTLPKPHDAKTRDISGTPPRGFVGNNIYPFYHYTVTTNGAMRAGNFEKLTVEVKQIKTSKCHKCGQKITALYDLTAHQTEIHDLRDSKGRRPKDFNNDKEYRHPATRGELERLQLQVINDKINKPKALVRQRAAQSRRDKREEAKRRQQLILVECSSCKHKYTTKENWSNWKGVTYAKCPQCGQGHLIKREHGVFVSRPTPNSIL
jgi:DNA-directed RNA polymerase subunit RPC12/RpoP